MGFFISPKFFRKKFKKGVDKIKLRGIIKAYQTYRINKSGDYNESVLL